MTSLDTLTSKLKRGEVYRREELAKYSKSVDRHVQQLLRSGTLKKVSPGAYYYPKKTAFGDAPPDDWSLVSQFLKDDHFLITSPNAYNNLGLGTTQLYNQRFVYNHKRHGDFKLGNRNFSFRVKPRFPKKMTEEFLLVDLMNNLDTLAEDSQVVFAKLIEKIKTMNVEKMKRNILEYGSMKTKKKLLPILENVKE